VLAHNAYPSSIPCNGTPRQFAWVTTHASFGARAIAMGYVDGIMFYANSAATTAGAVFTPTPRMAILNSGNVGIGTVSPGQALEVNGGARLNTAAAAPACGATTRGTFWVVQGATGVKDTVQVCAKDAANAYAWRTIY
jgi:hypothetical protein